MSLALAALLAMATAAAGDRPAERVVIFVMDGVRADDAVGASDGQLGVLSRFQAQGTTLRGLRSRDATTTEPAHRSLLTARRQWHGNFPWYDNRRWQRALTPTVLELAQRQLAGGALVTGNTVFMDSQGWSLYPGYLGQDHVAERVGFTLQSAPDAEIFATTLAELAKDERSLVVLNVHQPDKDAHRGELSLYQDGVVAAADLVEDFIASWGREGDAYVMVADHGRHEDRTQGHGDACAGCRESWALLWGEGIRAGAEAQVAADLTDVGATVAWLLGLDMPSARGRVLAEALLAPPVAPSAAQVQVDPALAVAGGAILVASQSLHGSGGGADLLLRRSTDAGATWTEQWLGPASGTERAEASALAAAGDRALLSWRAWSEAAQVWQLWARESADGGLSWAEPVVLDEAAAYFARADLALAPGSLDAHLVTGDEHTAQSDDVSGWERVLLSSGGAVSRSNPVAGSPGLHLPVEIVPAWHGDALWAVTSAVQDSLYVEQNEFRDLVALRLPGAPEEASEDPVEVHLLSGSDGLAFWPDLVSEGEVLQVAWATLVPDPGGGLPRWQVWSRRTVDDGATWEAPQVIALEHAHAWRPALAATAAGTHLAWIEVDDRGQHALLLDHFCDGALAGGRTLVETGSLLERVRIAALDEQRLVVTWAEAGAYAERSVQTLVVPLLSCGGGDSGLVEDGGAVDGGAVDGGAVDGGAEDGGAGPDGGDGEAPAAACAGCATAGPGRGRGLSMIAAALALAYMRRRRGST